MLMDNELLFLSFLFLVPKAVNYQLCCQLSGMLTFLFIMDFDAFSFLFDTYCKTRLMHGEISMIACITRLYF